MSAEPYKLSLTKNGPLQAPIINIPLNFRHSTCYSKVQPPSSSWHGPTSSSHVDPPFSPSFPCQLPQTLKSFIPASRNPKLTIAIAKPSGENLYARNSPWHTLFIFILSGPLNSWIVIWEFVDLGSVVCGANFGLLVVVLIAVAALWVSLSFLISIWLGTVFAQFYFGSSFLEVLCIFVDL